MVLSAGSRILAPGRIFKFYSWHRALQSAFAQLKRAKYHPEYASTPLEADPSEELLPAATSTCSEIKLYGGGGQFLQMSLSPAIYQRKNYIEPVPATWHYSRWLRLGRQFFQNDILAAEKSPLVHCIVSRTIIYNNQSYVLSKARIYKFGIVVDSQLLNKYSGSHIYEEKREEKKIIIRFQKHIWKVQVLRSL